MVGHSLGGGLAKIVGARCDKPVVHHRYLADLFHSSILFALIRFYRFLVQVALAGPGISESRGKLRINYEAINKNVINIKPDHDVVRYQLILCERIFQGTHFIG